ncbi:Inner membrane protein yohK [Raoultella planticola]|nr:Inner membrane protein yohK [Raoultella planticola]
MSDFQLSVLCLVVTLALYFANKRLYRRFHRLPLMPLVFTPILLVLILVFGHISYQNYMGEAHWLLWLLGPATIAFAVPVYDNLAVIKRHWMSLTAGVTTAVVVAVTSSVWLARLFTLPDEIQRSLAVRSVTTPFALAAAKPIGGQPELVALFVVITGVFGMAVGDALFMRLAIREGMAKGAGFGAASHGAGTARSYELGPQEGGGGQSGDDVVWRGNGTGSAAGAPADVLMFPGRAAGESLVSAPGRVRYRSRFANE